MKNRFFYKKYDEDGINVIELGYSADDNKKNLLLKVSPENGNNMFCFKIGKYEIVHYDPSFKLKSYYTGNPILYPLPNRVRNCRYEFNGEKFWQMKNGIPIFLHSLVYDETWSYHEPVIQEDKIILETFIEIDENHPIYEGFPFIHTLIVKYILTSEKLIFSYTVKNRDSKELPFGISFHTFFSKLSGERDTMFSIPAKYMMELTDDLLPTGRLLETNGQLFDLNKPVPVSSVNLDNCFTGMDKNEKVMIDYTSIGLKIFIDSTDDFTHMQVYTPSGKPFFCIEKQTCSTDAHNLNARGFKKESHLLIVPPSEEYSGDVEYSYSYNY
ncbi:MAG TPA: aldose 1-epimerase [Bacteroidales bacterium]|nr:aldose 1-epimerase [Bacteroidales bacterium]